MITTPITGGTKLATATPDTAPTFGSGEHIQATLPGYIQSASGLWTPDTRDSYGMDVDVSRVAGLVNQRPWAGFWNLRGRRFNATTGYNSHNQNAAEPMALVENPSASTVWVFIDHLEFGAVGADSRFSRYGGVTINSRGTAATVGNTGGFTQVSTVTNAATETLSAQFKVYPAGQFSVTVPGGTTPRKVAPMKSYETYFLEVNGTIILRPGTNVYWTTNEVPGGGSGTYDAFINFEWVEIDATLAAQIVAAMQAQSVV